MYSLLLASPTLLLADEQRVHLKIATPHGPKWILLNADGSPQESIPRDVYSFRWQYSVRYSSSSGAENWHIKFRPTTPYPAYIGTLHCLQEVLALPLDEDRRLDLIGRPYDQFIVTPAGFVIPYDEGDLVFHPKEFGLDPALPLKVA